MLSRVWYAGRRMRLEPGELRGGPALVLRLDRGKAYRIDPDRKLAVELDLERLRARAQMDVALAGELMGGADAAARTTELRAGKVIAGYACRGYRIAAGGVSMDLYVSKAVPLGVDAFAGLSCPAGNTDRFAHTNRGCAGRQGRVFYYAVGICLSVN